MTKIENSEITYLSVEMQILARKEGRGEITKKEYQIKFDELEQKRKEVTQKLSRITIDVPKKEIKDGD